MTTLDTTIHRSPAASRGLPRARGPLSESVLAVLAGGGAPLPEADAVRRSDPYGDGLQLLLHVLYELH